MVRDRIGSLGYNRSNPRTSGDEHRTTVFSVNDTRVSHYAQLAVTAKHNATHVSSVGGFRAASIALKMAGGGLALPRLSLGTLGASPRTPFVLRLFLVPPRCDWLSFPLIHRCCMDHSLQELELASPSPSLERLVAACFRLRRSVSPSSVSQARVLRPPRVLMSSVLCGQAKVLLSRYVFVSWPTRL